MQAMCGIAEPIVGVVLAGRLAHAPATVVVGDHVRVGVESEIALRIGRPFPAEGVTATDALAYVDAVAAAFELVDDHGADYARLSAAPLVADNAWNAGLVLGPASAPGGPGSLKGLRGIAFSGYGGIKKVEVSLDNGVNWSEAQFGADAGAYSFRTWWLNWTPRTAGRYQIAVRATDARGNGQPDEGVWNPGGYLWNKIEHQEIVVGEAA